MFLFLVFVTSYSVLSSDIPSFFLKYFLVSGLIFTDYPHLFRVDSGTIAIWLVFFDIIILRTLRRTMAYASAIHNNLDSLWQTFYIPLTVPQTLLISTSAFRFSRATNRFEISTRYWSLPSTSFNFLRNPMKSVRYLFTHFQSLANFANTRQRSVL
jgi:hypothetical protein